MSGNESEGLDGVMGFNFCFSCQHVVCSAASPVTSCYIAFSTLLKYSESDKVIHREDNHTTLRESAILYSYGHLHWTPPFLLYSPTC